MTLRYVTSLASAADLGVDQVGGKAATLSTLSKQHNVPMGFVITTQAFVAHFDRLGLSTSRATAPDDATLSRLRAATLDAELARAIHAAFAELPLVDGRRPICAVRSSALGEDGAAMSFAGQHATYYYVDQTELEQRVIDCWLSLWSRQAQSYRQRIGFTAAPRMAVIVQLMVPAEVSGVTFTRDPTGRAHDALVIESCWGLGAALVDGRVTPDCYIVRRDSHELVERRIGSKRFKVAEDLIEPVGTRLAPVPRHQQRIATLSPTQISQVSALAQACEAALGAPQDVEWAYARGTLHLLQSRPITTLPAAIEHTEGRWIAFKPLLENFTDAMTPLTVDILRRVIPPFGRFIDGRYYLEFDRLKKAVPLVLSESELAELALLKSERSDYRIDWLRVPAALAVIGLAYLSSGLLWVRSRNLAPDALGRFRQRCESVLRDSKLDPVASLRALLVGPIPFANAGQFPFQLNIAAVRYFFLLAALRWYLRRFADRFDAALVGPLCAGTEEMLSKRMLDALRATAHIAQLDPAIRRLVQSDRLEDLPNQLAVHPAAEPFVTALESFMADFGHRGTREFELAAPRWREDPTPLFVMIRNLVREGITQATASPATERQREAERALAAALPGRLRRAVAHRLVNRIRYYATLRENTRHYTMLAFATVRTKILALEQQLLAQDLIACADDVFFLTWDEVESLRAGQREAHATQALIRRRRLLHIQRNRNKAPLTINVGYQADLPGSGVLAGQCASPGFAEGTVRLVLDPATDGEIRSGEILVAPFTDPAWTPLFLGASAVVVETGSYLSHAGTIARELGIPCLVDVAGAMDALRNGQRLCVDATNGKAFLLAETDTRRE